MSIGNAARFQEYQYDANSTQVLVVYLTAARPPIACAFMEAEAKAYDIDAILAKTDAKAVVPALITAICTRKTRKLFGRELDIFWLDRVHSGVFIDGIHGVLVNYDLSVLVFASKAMVRIGAIQRAGILKEAVDSFGDEALVREITKSFRIDMVTTEQHRLFEEFDSRYYKIGENFGDLAVAYIRQNIDDFRECGART